MDTTFTETDYKNLEHLIAVTITTSAWRMCYMVLGHFFPKKTPEYYCRMVALIHGLLTAFLGVNQCLSADIPFYHPEWKTTNTQSFILAVSAGYFIHDLVWCIQFDAKDKLMIVHHIYCVIFLLRILFKGISGAQTTCGLGAMELTNPLLQARWFIRSGGIYPSLLFLSIETVFLITYFLIRIVLGTSFMWVIIRHPKNDIEFITFSIMIYVISWMFFFNIIRYLMSKYSGPKGGKGINEELVLT